MRTTLTIDDDVHAAAKALAQQQDRSLGDVISDLARQSLHRPQSHNSRNGIFLLPVTSGTPRVTLDVVNALRDGMP